MFMLAWGDVLNYNLVLLIYFTLILNLKNNNVTCIEK